MKPRRRRLTGVPGQGTDNEDEHENRQVPTKRRKTDVAKSIKPFARSYFEDICSEAGLQLSDDSTVHVLTCEPIKFLSNLKTTLEKNIDFPKNVSEFAKGCELWMEDDYLFESLLSANITYNQTGEDVETVASPVAGCVLQLLLRIECLQESLSTFVIRRATDFAISDEPNKVQMLLKPFVLLDNMTAESIFVDGLMEILKVSERVVRLEVITHLPDMVSERQHHSVALELCKLMNDDHELTPAILDCLTHFNLSVDLKSQVRNEMLTALQISVPIHFFPNLISFFFIGCAGEYSAETIRGVREGLDWTTSQNSSDVNVDSSQIMTILSLKAAMLNSKNLNAEWLKVINQVKSPDVHKPLDIIILLIIYSLSNAKEKIVENVFRKRIRLSMFTCSLLNLTIKMFKPVITEYVENCLKLAKSLLKSKNDPLVKEFSVSWIIVLFQELPSVQRNVISELIYQDFTDERELLSNSLTILLKIAAENIDSIKPFSLQILTLLNQIDTLNPNDTSRLMDLLCALAFKVENSNLKDDIHMFIQKQLSSTNLSIKCRGISGGIMAVKHLACSKTEKEIVDEVDESLHFDDIPEGPGKEAACIIKLILKSSFKFPEIVCFFYDQLSDMLNNCEFIDGKFLTWILSGFTNDFQNSYITDVQLIDIQPVDGIKLSQQFCLDTDEEVNEPIGLNIGNIVFGENIEKVNLQLLPSWFRNVQTLHKKAYDGQLLTIDALLGCAIIMPVVDDDIGLEEFNPSYFDKILHCFVYCINWFRELISAFSSQNDIGMKRKTVGRLNNLIMLERKLTVCLSKTSIVYQPPVSTFNSGNMKLQPFVMKENKVKKGSKKAQSSKKKDQEADLDNGSNETLQSQVNIFGTNSQTNIVKCRLNVQFFRNIQLDVLILLKENLYIEDLNENESRITSITLDSLLFLLDEINPKIALIFPSRVIKESHFKSVKITDANINPIETFHQCLILLPKICLHLESIAEYTHKIIEYNDGVRDAIGLFTDQNAKAQLCLTGIFQLFTNIFSWVGFQSSEHIAKFKDGLKVLATRNDTEENKLMPLKELLLETSKYVLRFKDYCLLISAAACLLKFFEVLVKIIDDNSLIEKFMNLSLEMLGQSWRDVYGNIEKGLGFNQNVNTLLNGYFSKPNIGMVKSLSFEVHQESSLLSKKNYVLSTFQCINKANFPLLFRSMCHALYEATKNEINKGLTDKQHLELWKDVSIVMKYFTDILKTADSRTNLATFLKQSIPLLKLFLSHGMPMLDMKLRSDSDSVVEILKTLQHSTRFLHSLYCHSRMKKDTALIAYLPQMKLILETLVYKVKVSLTVNNCSEAFWMGNLKNKNLQGELIPSQDSIQSEQSDDEDQLPEDDKSISSSECDEDSDMKSVSNIF